MKWYDELKRVLGRESAQDDALPACDSEAKCRDAVERIFEYLDGELEHATREEVAEHFRVCQTCYPALAFEESFSKALKSVQQGEGAPPAVRERILDVLRDEGYTP